MSRKTIFDTIRTERGGKPYSPADVAAVDALLDFLGVPKDETTHDPFQAALDEILVHEGGFSNHPADPGGMTNLGITKATWEAYTGKPASESIMRTLTREEVAPLYRANYWEACHCDDLPAGLALCVFDFAVNAGPGRASRFLQRLVGVSQDGSVGPATLAGVNTYIAAHGAPAAIQGYQDLRRNYYRSLPTFPTFGKGWLRRCDEVQTAAEGL